MNVAFIPVRGGSKSIPLKNIKEICGKPLIYWTVLAACRCKYIDKVYVASDSEMIRDKVMSFREEECFTKLEVIGRSAASATDTASTEFAMLEFAQKYEFTNIVLIQATSPMLECEDLNHGFETFEESETDSVLSGVKQKRFCWKNDSGGFANAVNYNVYNRPRRQEFEGHFVENGAFYITSKKALLESKNRISGRIKIVEMCEESFFEIDEQSDWEIVEYLMKRRKRKDEIINIPEIKLVLSDCDGCMTDGGMYYAEDGNELKKFNTKDGMGFAMLQEQGVLTGIITGEDVSLNYRRAKKLKVNFFVSCCQDKKDAVMKICQENGISLENVAYIGDDINDKEVIEMVGFGCCPVDAVSQIKKVASYVTKAKGGEGVIREVAEIVLNRRR